jgi:hypothetical protein
MQKKNSSYQTAQKKNIQEEQFHISVQEQYTMMAKGSAT